MKQVLTGFCLLILFASTVAAQENGSIQNESLWQRYTVKDDDFSIKLPLLPAMTTTSTFFWPDRKEYRERHLGVYADGVVYMIYSLDGHIEESLKDSIKGYRARTAWGADTEKDLTVDGFAGKQYSRPEYVAQVFATKKRFYRFEVRGALPDDPRVKPFFDSLTLGEKGDAIEVSDGQGIAYQPGPQSTTPISMEKYYTGKDVDKKPRLAMKIEPQYTEEARQGRVTGTVVLKVVFSANGSVNNILTVSSLPGGLTERAIDAARKIKFIPGMKDGKYVSVWMQLEYNFNLY
jgi:TonB family protein